MLLSNINIPIFIFLLIAFVFGLILIRIFRKSKFIVEKKSRKNKSILFSGLFIIVFMICSYAVLYIISNQQPSFIEISIRTPDTNQTIESKELVVKGRISPSTSSVYLLVHPEDNDVWWVQDLPSVNRENGKWEGICYLGTDSMGKYRKYDIIALGSKHSWIVNSLLNKHIYPGDTIKILPLLTKTEIIVVERIK